MVPSTERRNNIDSLQKKKKEIRNKKNIGFIESMVYVQDITVSQELHSIDVFQ